MNTRIQSKIGRIFNRHFLIPRQAVRPRIKLQDLGLNNMEQMEVMLYLESEFRIALSDRDVQDISTVGDAIAAVERYVSLRAA
ncbi:MAG: acyl carrier protein [Bacteroidota bacterium]